MSIFSKLFGKKQTEGEETSRIDVGGMEDFMTLIRVYYQSVMACNIGITNINFLPDIGSFQTFVQNPHAKQAAWELLRSHACKKDVDAGLYGISENFF